MKVFQTECFIMKISEDLIKEITVKKNVLFSSFQVEESIKLATNAFKPDTKFYVLLEGEEGADVSADAKRYAASEAYSRHAAALALYSSNPLQAIAGNLFVKINKPKTPTRFFDDRQEALRWLKAQAALANK